MVAVLEEENLSDPTIAEATHHILHESQSKTNRCDRFLTSQLLGILNPHEPNKWVGVGSPV